MPRMKLVLQTIPAVLLLLSQAAFAETHVVTAIGMKYFSPHIPQQSFNWW